MADKKYLDPTGLALLWEKIKNKLNLKVDKVDGKGLSTNDYTTDEKNKLSNIAAGAQVNTLEGIQKNGQTVTIQNKIANIAVPTNVSELNNDAGYVTSSEIPEGATATTTVPKMDGTAAVGTEMAFARGDHVHPTDTSRAAASALTAVSSRVDALESAVGSGGSVDSKIAAAISELDSSIASEANKAIASVTITDGKISASTKVSIPTAATATPVMDGTAAVGTATTWARADHVHPIDTSRAPLASPAFTGTPTAPTPSAGNNSTNIATTAFVNTAISSAVADITSFEFEVVTTLPASGEKGIIYLVAHAHGTGDAYDEYIWTGTAFEKIGNTDIDLSGYQLSAELKEITSSEIDAICI